MERYKALGVPEVWFWIDGVFALYRLQDNAYKRISKSEISELAKLDLDLLTQFVLMAETSRLEAAKEFCEAIRQ